MKTAELTGAALDWAVAKCEGVTEGKDGAWYYDRRNTYNYSTDWAQGGPIIEREKITWTGQSGRICRYMNGSYQNFEAFGPTPLIATMRCYVASKLGDTIDIPEELK